MTFDIRHDPHAGRFEALVEGHRCFTAYERRDGVMTLPHTEVPAPVAGRGIGEALVDAALAHARDEGLRVDPRCSFVRAYMERHPETHPLRA